MSLYVNKEDMVNNILRKYPKSTNFLAAYPILSSSLPLLSSRDTNSLTLTRGPR